MKITLDLITSTAEIVGAICIVSGIAVLLGLGAGLIASGIALIGLSYLASAGTE